MSIMFAGLDRAVGNMDVGRHSAIVDAIETGDADEAAKRFRRTWTGPQRIWSPDPR